MGFDALIKDVADLLDEGSKKVPLQELGGAGAGAGGGMGAGHAGGGFGGGHGSGGGRGLHRGGIRAVGAYPVGWCDPDFAPCPPRWRRRKKKRKSEEHVEARKQPEVVLGPPSKKQVQATLAHMSDLAHQQTQNAQRHGTLSALRLAAVTHARVAHAATMHGEKKLAKLHGQTAKTLSGAKPDRKGAVKLKLPKGSPDPNTRPKISAPPNIGHGGVRSAGAPGAKKTKKPGLRAKLSRPVSHVA